MDIEMKRNMESQLASIDRYLADINQRMIGLTHQQIVRWRMKCNFIDEILDMNREALADPYFTLSLEEFLNSLNAYEFAMRLLADDQFHETYVRMLLDTQVSELKNQSDPELEASFVEFHNAFLVPVCECKAIHEVCEYQAGKPFDFEQSARQIIQQDEEIANYYQQRENRSLAFLNMMNSRLLRVIHRTYDC